MFWHWNAVVLYWFALLHPNPKKKNKKEREKKKLKMQFKRLVFPFFFFWYTPHFFLWPPLFRSLFIVEFMSRLIYICSGFMTYSPESKIIWLYFCFDLIFDILYECILLCYSIQVNLSGCVCVSDVDRTISGDFLCLMSLDMRQRQE